MDSLCLAWKTNGHFICQCYKLVLCRICITPSPCVPVCSCAFPCVPVCSLSFIYVPVCSPSLLGDSQSWLTHSQSRLVQWLIPVPTLVLCMSHLIVGSRLRLPIGWLTDRSAHIPLDHFNFFLVYYLILLTPLPILLLILFIVPVRSESREDGTELRYTLEGGNCGWRDKGAEEWQDDGWMREWQKDGRTERIAQGWKSWPQLMCCALYLEVGRNHGEGLSWTEIVQSPNSG